MWWPKESEREGDTDGEGSRRARQEEDAGVEGRGGEYNPVRARWNENAVTRNKRGGDPKLLVEVQPEGLGMSLRRGGDETLP